MYDTNIEVKKDDTYREMHAKKNNLISFQRLASWGRRGNL
jgi:hypothetical protein